MEDNTTLSLLSSYPVGSIYQSVNTTSPASLFGGSWEKIEGRFLLGSSSEYDIGDTGGASEYLQEWLKVGYHNHAIYTNLHPTTNTEYRSVFNIAKYGDLFSWKKDYEIAGATITNSPGEGINETRLTEPMPIMPPYYCVNIWRRTA